MSLVRPSYSDKDSRGSYADLPDLHTDQPNWRFRPTPAVRQWLERCDAASPDWTFVQRAACFILTMAAVRDKPATGTHRNIVRHGYKYRGVHRMVEQPKLEGRNVARTILQISLEINRPGSDVRLGDRPLDVDQ